MKIVRYSDGTIRHGLLEEDGTIRPLLGSPFESLETTGPATRLEKVSLLAPLEPANIFAAGVNYRDHQEESNRPAPSLPMLFMKPAGTIAGPGSPIVYPKGAELVHYEGELAVVIGRSGRHIPEDRALEYVLGYSCANDVSERITQRAEMKQGTMLIGKAYDSFCPIGPVIATGLDPSDLTLETRHNGRTVQSTSTAMMMLSVPALISYISQAITLRPCDIILTGTPSGVGPIQPGDTVEVEISGIGVLKNPVLAA